MHETMSAAHEAPGDSSDRVHDHAWRRVSAATEYGVLYNYECDICSLTWVL